MESLIEFIHMKIDHLTIIHVHTNFNVSLGDSLKKLYLELDF